MKGRLLIIGLSIATCMRVFCWSQEEMQKIMSLYGQAQATGAGEDVEEPISLPILQKQQEGQAHDQRMLQGYGESGEQESVKGPIAEPVVLSQGPESSHDWARAYVEERLESLEEDILIYSELRNRNQRLYESYKNEAEEFIGEEAFQGRMRMAEAERYRRRVRKAQRMIDLLAEERQELQKELKSSF